MCGTEIISKVKGETAMKVVATEKAPKALGPYSQGYVHAGVLYTAGQIAIDPAVNDVTATTI